MTMTLADLTLIETPAQRAESLARASKIYNELVNSFTNETNKALGSLATVPTVADFKHSVIGDSALRIIDNAQKELNAAKVSARLENDVKSRQAVVVDSLENISVKPTPRDGALIKDAHLVKHQKVVTESTADFIY